MVNKKQLSRSKVGRCGHCGEKLGASDTGTYCRVCGDEERPDWMENEEEYTEECGMCGGKNSGAEICDACWEVY